MKVNSTNINEIHHTSDGLTVSFHSGRTYHYPDVPLGIYEALVEEAWKTDGSVGKLFNRLVKQGGFPSIEVDS